MNKFLKPFIKTCFINIYFNREKVSMLVEVSKNGVVLSKEKKEFEDCIFAEKVSISLQRYLENIQLLYDFTYITILDTSLVQGGFSSSIAGYKEKFLQENIIHKKIAKKIFYTFSSNITNIKKLFLKSGVDFIVSPFLLIEKFKYNKYLDGKDRVFILNSFNFVAIAIYNKNLLKFSSFFTLTSSNIIDDDHHEDETSMEVEKGSDNIVELDLLDDDDDDLFDNDSVDTKQLLSEVENENILEMNGEDLDIFSRDIKMIEYLKKSISEYYKNEVYDSDFVEEIVIYTDLNVSSEASSMIEDELFLSTKIEEKYFLNILNNITREEYESI